MGLFRKQEKRRPCGDVENYYARALCPASAYPSTYFRHIVWDLYGTADRIRTMESVTWDWGGVCGKR